MQRPTTAIAFYQAAFGAEVVHRVGAGEDIVAQLAVDDAYLWVANADPERGRFDAAVQGGGTGRMLLVVGDPDAVFAAAVAAGASVTSAMGDEHGWRLGRITDPAGQQWEIGTPLGPWPPSGAGGGSP